MPSGKPLGSILEPPGIDLGPSGGRFWIEFGMVLACSQLRPPARARSARARLQAIVRACCLDSRVALATLALLLLVVLPLGLLLLLLLSLLSLRLQCLQPLYSHALPVPSIARFRFLGVFCNPLNFSKNATPSMRKPCFLISGGSQNGAKMAPKMLQKSSSGAGGLRESLRERFWNLEPPGP